MASRALFLNFIYMGNIFLEIFHPPPLSLSLYPLIIYYITFENKRNINSDIFEEMIGSFVRCPFHNFQIFLWYKVLTLVILKL
jgi:hypothetical protein